jgi:acetyltransferase-like isoleucine patch superfamily enzyme
MVMLFNADQRRQLETAGLFVSILTELSLSFFFENKGPTILNARWIGSQCSVMRDTVINNSVIYNNTQIGRYCSFGHYCSVGADQHPVNDISTSFQITPTVSSGQTTIGNDVWIGNNTVVLNGLVIGDGAVIGAGAVVTKDVEPYAIVAGVPAKVLRYRFPQAIRDRMILSEWWRYPKSMIAASRCENIEKTLSQIERLDPALKETIELCRVNVGMGDVG